MKKNIMPEGMGQDEKDMDIFAGFFADLCIAVLVLFMFTLFIFGITVGKYLAPKEYVKEEKIVTVEKPVYVFLSDTIVIPKGGSLCGTLKMTETEAVAFAKKFNYPIIYNDWREPIVIVHYGDKFIQAFQPDTLKHLFKKKA